MARALIVGCGCRGRSLGAGLLDAGWLVRGTTRSPTSADPIAAAGIEPAVADPIRVASVLDQVDDVSLVFWLLGTAAGDRESIAALHGSRLARMLEEIVDTPVRGFVYEAAGSVPGPDRDRGAGLVRAAGERWRIPVEIVSRDPAEHDGWRAAMVAAGRSLLG